MPSDTSTPKERKELGEQMIDVGGCFKGSARGGRVNGVVNTYSEHCPRVL